MHPNLTPVKCQIDMKCGKIEKEKWGVSFELLLNSKTIEDTLKSSSCFQSGVHFNEFLVELALKEDSSSSLSEISAEISRILDSNTSLKSSIRLVQGTDSLFLSTISHSLPLKVKALLKTFKPRNKVGGFRLDFGIKSGSDILSKKEKGAASLLENSEFSLDVEIPGSFAFDIIEVLKENALEAIPSFKSENFINFFNGIKAELEFDSPSEILQDQNTLLEIGFGAFIVGILEGVQRALVPLAELRTEKTRDLEEDLNVFLVFQELGAIKGRIHCPYASK